MTSEEIFAAQREERRFSATPAGGALLKYERLLGRAWITDSTSHSDRAMKRDWDASNAARLECIEAIKALHRMIADLSDDLRDEGCDYSVEGLEQMRRRAANALPSDMCPDWLAKYRDPAVTGGSP